MPHSGCHFLRFWRILAPKLSILGSPWRPAGHQMTPKIAQVAPKSFKKNIRWCSLLPTCFQDRVRNAPGHHFVGFVMDFDLMFKVFPKFEPDFRYQFGPSFCTPPRIGLLFYYKILSTKKYQTKCKEQMQSTNIFRKSSFTAQQVLAKSADPLRAVERVRVFVVLRTYHPYRYKKRVNKTVTSPNPSQHRLRTFPEVPPGSPVAPRWDPVAPRWLPGGIRWLPGGIRKNPAVGKQPSSGAFFRI